MSADPPTDNEVPARLSLVLEEIALAAEAAGRDAASVKLVAVTKTVPAAVIEQAIGAGQRCFGENRVQEAASKWPALKARHPGIELHLIGPLQSNKVREAVDLFDVIETVDRPKLARALAEEMARVSKRPRLFVQVNTGEEPQKAGVAPGETESFVALCRETFGLVHRRADVHPALRRRTGDAFRPARQARRASRHQAAQHGHERRFRPRHRLRRHVRACRHRHLWRARDQ